MSATTDLIVGDRIGNYRIELELACDGLCVTYRATHQVLPRRAVLKVMHAASGPPRAVHMLREACILDALHHPGVVRVYESGLLPDRRPWFACEHVEGTPLSSVLPTGGRGVPSALGTGGTGGSGGGGAGPVGAIDRLDAVTLLRDLAAVLEHAHQRGVVHCGLRPSRVLLTNRARGYPLCIADWSEARAHDAAPAPFVVTPESWHYTPPELAAGDTVDDRTDVFALGVIAYQLLTGAVPYENRAVAAAADGSTQHVPTAFRCADAPRELTTLIDQMLAYARWDRPSGSESHDGLAAVADAMLASARASSMRIRRPRWTPVGALDEVTPLDKPEARQRAPTDREDERS